MRHKILCRENHKHSPSNCSHLRHSKAKHRLSLIERFCAKISIGDDCWLWLGNTYGNGYAKFSVNEKYVPAYRTAYELFCGVIPSKLFVCHKCDNGSCVRPLHLFIGTQSDNMKDCVAKGRWRTGNVVRNLKTGRIITVLPWN